MLFGDQEKHEPAETGEPDASILEQPAEGEQKKLSSSPDFNIDKEAVDGHK